MRHYFYRGRRDQLIFHRTEDNCSIYSNALSIQMSNIQK